MEKKLFKMLALGIGLATPFLSLGLGFKILLFSVIIFLEIIESRREHISKDRVSIYWMIGMIISYVIKSIIE